MRFFEGISRLRDKQPVLAVVSGFAAESVAFKNKQLGGKGGRSVGRKSCELTEIVLPLRSTQIALIASSMSFERENAATARAFYMITM